MMNLLERYIGKSVLSSLILVTLLLCGLQIFILFVNQLDDLGKGDFNLLAAMWFVLLQLPYQLYLFFPMASLLGCLIGLGILANHHELIVMRAAGMSIAEVTIAILKIAVILILFVTWIGETWAPKLVQLANDHKILAITKGQSLRTAKGLWLRYQNDFISIGSVISENQLEDVFQFHFDDAHDLRMSRKIQTIVYQNGQWQASNIAETRILGETTEVSHLKEQPWEVSLRPSFFGVSSYEADEMTLKELRRYIRTQKANHQTAGGYQYAYYQRLIQPLTTVVMMILAIPFIFGPLRSSTMGSKLLVGATMGFGFHVINHFFGPLSQVMFWPPQIAAIAPTCLFAILGVYLMLRAR